MSVAADAQPTLSREIGSALRQRRETSLTSLVRSEIERLIEQGELKAGDWVNEALVAAKLGVSRGPVREACRGLERSGLVTMIVNRGAFVREISAEEARQLYELRAALFGFAGYRLAMQDAPVELSHARSLLDQMRRAVEADDLDTYYHGNLEFHRTLLVLAGNGRLVGEYAGYVRQLHLFRRRALVSPGRMAASNNEHAAIIDAIAARDAPLARRLMESHVLDSRGWVVPSRSGASPAAGVKIF